MNSPVADMQCDLGAFWQPHRPVWCSRCFSCLGVLGKHIAGLDGFGPTKADSGRGGFLFIAEGVTAKNAYQR